MIRSDHVHPNKLDRLVKSNNIQQAHDIEQWILTFFTKMGVLSLKELAICIFHKDWLIYRYFFLFWFSSKNSFWANQNKQQILWKKKSGFVNSRLGVPSDEQDIYHQYFHFQLNLCRSCILPNILLKCRKAGCQLATTQWGEIKSEGVSFFL